MTLRSVDHPAAGKLGHRLGDGHAAVSQVDVPAPQAERFTDPQPAVREDQDQEVIRRGELGLVVTSVGTQLVIDDPFGHPRATTTVTILGGTALFLVGRALLRYLVYRRLFGTHLIGLIALACLLPPMLLLPPLVNAIATGAVLTGIVIADTIRVRRPAAISTPGPHRPSNT
ncbi:low temperature requirement protein A [Micromonospora sp. IBSANI012]|uniref:low temperature requirement protein A n=1 Tax=Micromonospora sp. IBSANI012 TaxID=3457761 RepID=UPI0040582D5C